MIIVKHVDGTVIAGGESFREIFLEHKHNLQGANLSKAYLAGADLRLADLRKADLRWSDLRGADLRLADLGEADLRKACLHEAVLIGADLRLADLKGADLRGADFYEADLRWADFSGAKLPDFQIPNGDLIAWKKVEGYIVELLIPAAAKRTATLIGRKCRAEYAIDVFHHSGPEELISDGMGNGPVTTYRVGKTIYPDCYCNDIRIECSHGIHFFRSREEAEEFF